MFDKICFGFSTLMLCVALAFGFWLSAVIFAVVSVFFGYLIHVNKKEGETKMTEPETPFEVDYFGCEEDTMEANIALVALDFVTDSYKSTEQQNAALDYLDRYIRSGL